MMTRMIWRHYANATDDTGFGDFMAGTEVMGAKTLSLVRIGRFW